MNAGRNDLLNKVVPLICLLLLLPVSAYSQFSELQRLASGTPSAYWSIATYEKFVHVVFWDDRFDNDEIFYKGSTDGGLTWGADKRLTNALGKSITPSVAVSGQIVHVVWADDRDGNMEVYYKASMDNGVNWGPDIRLTNAAGFSGGPSIVSTPNYVHVVWNDNRDGNHEIYYKRGDGGGNNWSPDTRLTTTPETSVEPCLAISGNNLHLVWKEGASIHYKRSTSNGNVWDFETPISHPPSSQYLVFSQYPSVAASGSDVHVVWMDNRDYSTSGPAIFYYRPFYSSSRDNGSTWNSERFISPAWSNMGQPSIGAHGQNVHVIWEGRNSDPASVDALYYLQSSNGGNSWNEQVALTTSPRELDRPSLALSEDWLHVIWAVGMDFPDIYYGRLPLGPDLDINDNALDLHNNIMEVNIGTRGPRVVLKNLSLCNTSFSLNPDPDGPSNDQVLVNMRQFRESPTPMTHDQVEALFRPCLTQLGLGEIQPAGRALPRGMDFSVVTCTSEEGNQIKALLILPSILNIGDLQRGQIVICAPKGQPYGFYKARVNVRYRSRSNPNRETEDYFRLRVNISRDTAGTTRGMPRFPEYGR